MNRSLKLSVLLALAVGSGQAAALELGQIQIKSALGQPLVAEIPVNPESPAELQNLTARLASSEEFARAGIGAPAMALQLTVVDAAGGTKAIRITSAVPVNDPYLDLLVEVDNAAGKSVREFTILLDPPNSPAAAPATKAPVASSSKPRRAAAPATSTSTEAAQPVETKPAPAKPAKPARQAAAAGGEIGPIERGQTLSGVARQAAPEGVDINQMMLALKQANPDAFYRDNINALKSGAVLRVPSREDAQALAVAAAMEEVRRQNSDWRAGTARAPTTVADAGTRANAPSAPTAKGGNTDRLALVPSKDGAPGGSGGGKGDKAAVAGLHQDLLRSQEALTSLEQQGNELKSRLKDLEDINAKNSRLLSLKDSEIADLQRKLADARKVSGQPEAAKPAAPVTEAAKPAVAEAKPEAAKPAEAGPTLAVTPAGATSVPAKASTAAATSPVASKPAEAPKPAVKPPVAKKPTPAPVAEEPWYMQTWALAAGGGAVVLLLLGLLRRRRKAPAEAVAASSSSSLADRFGAGPTVGSADPDQDELLDQLAEHPDDIGLHLELVSLYYSRRDVEHFEAAAEAMHAHIAGPDQPEWQDVVHMGEDLVPGHPLFSHGVVSAHDADAHDALDDFDLGRYAEEHESDIPPIPAAPLPNKKVSEYHFDFDLTPRPTSHGQPAADAPVEREQASSWQFAELDDDLQTEEDLQPTAGAHHHDDGEFSDDPVDTKLDLARAYLDMGDPDGARAMLEEVMHEGTQLQKEVARKLLENIH